MVSKCVSARSWGLLLKSIPFLLLLPVASVYGQLIPTLVVFAVVLWHEAVHVLTALYYGMRVVEIEILPFGGVARMDDLMQFEPHIEAAVAAVGPISNLVLLGIFACGIIIIQLILIGWILLPGLTLVWLPSICCQLYPLMVDGFCAAA